MRKLFASLAATFLLAGGVASTAAAQQEADGLVVVQIDNVLNNNDVNVIVPISAAAAVAANICNVNLSLAVLGEVDQETRGPITATCDSASRAFNEGDITVSNN